MCLWGGPSPSGEGPLVQACPVWTFPAQPCARLSLGGPVCHVLQGAIGQEYGKYGIIRETDMYAKRPEFQVRLWTAGPASCCFD